MEAVTAKERSRHKVPETTDQTNAGPSKPRLQDVPISDRDRSLASHASVIGGSDKHGRLNQSFFSEWGQDSWGRD